MNFYIEEKVFIKAIFYKQSYWTAFVKQPYIFEDASQRGKEYTIRAI